MRRTAQILSVDNQEYEAAGVALNCFSLLNHVRAALEGPAADRAPCGVKSRPTDCPKLMTLPTAMATGIGIKTQSRT
jgi:hypothetical protein